MRKAQHLLMTIALVAISGCGGGSSTGSSAQSAAVPSTTTGTIAGFGSIVINGTHYDTSSASFVLDDVPGSQSALSAGQVVTIVGTNDGQGNHVAHSVEFNSVLVGPVSSIDPTGNTFTALGQTLSVDVTTLYAGVADFAALAVGNTVAVSGSRDSSGNIAATFVRLLSTAPANVRLSGPVANLDTAANTFTIGGETISFPGATIVPSNAVLQDGLPVVVVGTLDNTGTTITASKVRVHKPFDGGGSGEQGELEGIITQAAQNNSFAIGTAIVDYDSTTTFVGGTASDLVAGTRVEAHGVLNADGSLQATKIEVEVSHHANHTIGLLLGALSAAPDTTSSPNTISLLGATVIVTSSTILSDHHQDDQMFKLSDLAAGDEVAVAVLLTPAASAGDPPTLTALKIERPNASVTASGVSGPFSNANASALTLTVDTTSVIGQQDCPPPSGGPSGSIDPTCTSYFIRGHSSTGTAFFQALSDPANANSVVLALGAFAGGALTAQSLDLQSLNQSGDGEPHSH